MFPNDCHDKYILMIEMNINVISNLRHISDSCKKKTLKYGLKLKINKILFLGLHEVKKNVYFYKIE
jgi:hypothetical protein